MGPVVVPILQLSLVPILQLSQVGHREQLSQGHQARRQGKEVQLQQPRLALPLLTVMRRTWPGIVAWNKVN